MGLSSSLLDESKFNFIKSWAQTELGNFAPIYKKQYTLAFLSHVHDELVQRKQENTQLLKRRDPPQESEVVYQETVFYFCLNRKWKKRFVVVRANYSLECHESYETFMKGVPPLNTLPTTGGTILTTEEKYMEMVDSCFPETDNMKEDFSPPLGGMPGQFPVYLRLPYHRDYYFCFLQEADQALFISMLSDCIRHQNQDFLKKKTYEVQAFVKAVQIYRQEKGYYEAWDMLIGDNVQVLANLTMEELMPSLEKDLLSRLKARRMDKKKMWFATVEAAYDLVHDTLMEGMTALNDECRETVRHQSALMRSDMDQIMSSRTFLESKLKATVAELATEYCKQHIEPRLPAMLEEVMGPISLGFAEARQVSESMMELLCKKCQTGLNREELQEGLVEMSKPNLQGCYEKVSGLRGHIHEFSYPNCRGLEQSTQIDVQQLVDSASYTFGLLLNECPQDDTTLLDAMIKAKQRVLKQYDYDSSALRKTIFQEALMSVTLPGARAFLAPTFKAELANFQQYIFDDYINFINVENIYEDILQEILEQHVSKVVKEAASMKKYNLHMESRYRCSSYITPPDSPDYTSSVITACHTLPSSPLLSRSLTESQSTDERPGMSEKKVEQEASTDQQVEVEEHAQPPLIKVDPSEDTMVEQPLTTNQQDNVQAQAKPDLIKVPDSADLVMAENKVEPKIPIQTHEQPEIIKVHAEKSVKAQVIVQINSQPERVAQEVIMQKQPDLKSLAVEGLGMAEKKEELEDNVQKEAQSDPSKIPPDEHLIMAEQEQIPVQLQAQPDLINRSHGEDIIAPEKTVKQQIVIQSHAEPVLKVSTSVEVKERHKMEETEVLSTPVTVAVEKTLAATPNFGEKTYSEPRYVPAINAATSPDSSSNEEPAPDTAVQSSPPDPANPTSNPTPLDRASPPEDDEGSICSDLSFVSTDSKMESGVNIRRSSAEEDSSVALYDLTSRQTLQIYNTRESNMTQYFSDDSSWTTEEEEDIIEEDDVTAVVPNQECETTSDGSENTEAARPLDCIKEIRELVLEQKLPQHDNDD